MFTRIIVLISFSLILLVSTAIPQESIIVAKFGNQKITLDEFEYAYAKNVGGWDAAEQDSLQQYENFLNLYVKFRMKLRDAWVRGFDTEPALQDELNNYKKQIGKSYIIEKQIIQPGIEQLYNRRKEELRISHIMIKPIKGDDNATFEKAQAILDSIKNGASFEEMAKKYSDDKFSGPKGGDIYYVTAGLLPYTFEDAMYTLQPGEIYPEPVKTKYGYHLIKCTARQARIPKIRASHILISYFNDEGKVDSAAAKQIADSVLAKIRNGESFEKLAGKYSDDTSTKTKGGDLGFFERRQMVQAFDEVAFSMKVGEVSDLVQTNFGYHIIKVTGKKDYPPFDEEKENLKKIYQKQRYNADYAAYIDSLKSRDNYVFNEVTVDAIVNNCDSTRFGVEYPNPDSIKGLIVFSYADKNLSAKDFLDEVNHDSDFMGKPIFLKSEVMKAVKKLTEDKLMEEAALNLNKTDPGFASLMNDYKDGVYIFKLQEDEVWNKLHVDSADVYNYWTEHKGDYMWPDRISFGEIFSMRDSLIQKYYGWLQEGADFDSLATLYTERPGKKKDHGRYNLQDVNFSDLSREANKLENPGNFSKPVPFSGGYSIFKLFEREPAGVKSFEEVRAEIAGLLQEKESKKLENEYITKLENRYHPVIFYDEIEKAFKPRKED